jgi:hypothetical protein
MWLTGTVLQSYDRVTTCSDHQTACSTGETGLESYSDHSSDDYRCMQFRPFGFRSYKKEPYPDMCYYGQMLTLPHDESFRANRRVRISVVSTGNYRQIAKGALWHLRFDYCSSSDQAPQGSPTTRPLGTLLASTYLRRPTSPNRSFSISS